MSGYSFCVDGEVSFFVVSVWRMCDIRSLVAYPSTVVGSCVRCFRPRVDIYVSSFAWHGKERRGKGLEDETLHIISSACLFSETLYLFL